MRENSAEVCIHDTPGLIRRRRYAIRTTAGQKCVLLLRNPSPFFR